ncbi:MAG TPA: hypothetical protein VFN03_13090, partial [Trueperaceae bacterium]|nr:hypothetical protein [Trueperaceae bacterium]
ALELTLAHAVTRTQVVLERALAILLRGLSLAATGVAVIWALAGPSQLDLTLTGVLAVSASLVALTMVIGMAALCAGALTGRRAAATTVGAGVAVMAYVLDATARATGIEWLGRVSPVTWAFGSDPITTGFAWAGLANLAGVSLALLVVGLIGFRRRDMGRG